MPLLNRIPKIHQIAPVYAVGVALLYSWTIYNTMRAFSTNWGMFLGMDDVLGLIAYMLVGDFLESLLWIGILLGLCFLLPGSLLKDKFILRGSILTVTFLGSIMVFYLQLSDNLFVDFVLKNINKWITLFTVSTIVFLTAVELIKPFGEVIKSLADRFIVFLYLYLPLTFLAILVIIFRNIG